MTSNRLPRYATSVVFDSIVAELEGAGDRKEIVQTCDEIAVTLRKSGLPDHYWDYLEIGRGAKKNFAQRFSANLAQKFADGLRPRFRGVLPTADGKGQESKSAGAAGLKKLDVNYSTIQSGLGLGISIKTLNFKDEKTNRYTKNVRRIDGELRAEAQDYHTRQPYAVLAALVFLPEDSAWDGAPGASSSFKHVCDVYRARSGRTDPRDDHSKFERIWVCLYDSNGENRGACRAYDVQSDIPPTGHPEGPVTLTTIIAEIEAAFRKRNKP